MHCAVCSLRTRHAGGPPWQGHKSAQMVYGYDERGDGVKSYPDTHNGCALRADDPPALGSQNQAPV